MMQIQSTIRWMGYDPTTLSPGSHKKVWDICASCGMAILRARREVGRLCIRCVRKGIPLPIDVRKKMSAASIGKVFTPEHRESIRQAAKRRLSDPKNHPMYGRTHSPESIKKMRNVKLGKQVSDETRAKLSDACMGEKNGFYGKTHSKESRQSMSATKQHLSYDEWEEFAKDQPYCPKFNEVCRESNREKYDRQCFVCSKPESENVLSSGKHIKLSVHHIDMDKTQGCDGHEWRLVPLCRHHHGSSAHTPIWIARIQYLLNHVWSGA